MIPIFRLQTIRMNQTPHNFTLRIVLWFYFDGTLEQAKEKLADDVGSFTSYITEGLTGTGLEYAVSPGS